MELLIGSKLGKDYDKVIYCHPVYSSDAATATVAAAAAAAKSLQSCPTLCDPIDHGSPGSAIPGILQARTLEWVAISSPIMRVKSES